MSRPARPLVAISVAAAALVAIGAATAYWTGGSSPGGSGAARAASLPPIAAPAAALAGRTATVSWSQATVLGSPLGDRPGGGYVVTRHAADGPETAIDPTGSCAGIVSGAAEPLSCAEALPTGRWRYRVEAALHDWRGDPGPAGAVVAVAPEAPLSVALANGTGAGSAYASAANAASLSFDVLLPPTSLGSDVVTLEIADGASVVTASAPGIAGGGTRTLAGVDVSALADGTLTVSVAVTSAYGDASAPTASELEKDTAAPRLERLLLEDVDADGRADRVAADFDAPLAPYGAGTAPWTLANVPSGGTLTGVSVSGATVALELQEGAGPVDTTVGSLTVALAAVPTGVRDAAGNLSSFAPTAPEDGVAPVRAGAPAMLDDDRDGRVDRVTVAFSETLGGTPSTGPWTLANVPSAGALSAVSVSGASAVLEIAEGPGAEDTAVGSFALALAAAPGGIADAAGNLASFGTVAPADGARPALTSLVLRDANANGKVDRVAAGFSEALAAYAAGAGPWALAGVPSNGTLSSVSAGGTTATLVLTEGPGAQDTAVGTMTVRLAEAANGIRDATGNRTSFSATAPADGAAPVVATGGLEMLDADADGRVDRITARFTETLDTTSPASEPWTLASVPSGGSLASVSIAADTATLEVAEGAGAPSTAVGSLTVALAADPSGVVDAAGNRASVASTAPLDRAAPAATARALRDNDVDGRVDRLVIAFSETLASYSAGTGPWALSSVPSGGSLSSVSTSGANATLTISEGAGAQDTAVGAMTVALASAANGIRDAAGNRSSFAASVPEDEAAPVLVANGLEMLDADADGRIDRVTAAFSETLAPYSAGTTSWTLTNTPSSGTLADVTVAAHLATLDLTEGTGTPTTAVGSFRIALATHPDGIRDTADNRATFSSRAPVDRAAPAVVTATLQDTGGTPNGRVDRLVVSFSESLSGYAAGTAPWTLSSVPSGGSLSSVSTSGANATLTISEGAGAQDTAVGAMTVRLADAANGVRDAAGNRTSFDPLAPSDGARPVLATGGLEMLDADADGRIDRVTAAFSETLAPYSAGTTSWTLTNTPSSGTLADVTVAAHLATLDLTEGTGTPTTAVGSFRIALATHPDGIRDTADNRGSFSATAPSDAAAPAATSLLLLDADLDGRVDRVTVAFSETLASYTAGTSPWSTANVPSGGALDSVSVSGSTATLALDEGPGARDTAVGAMTVALAEAANGVRDAAGNRSSFAGAAPADGARPIPVAVVSANGGSTTGLVEAGDTFAVTFSEPIASAVGPGTTVTLADPSGSGNDTLTIAGLTNGAVSTGSNDYVTTNNRTASFAGSSLAAVGATITATVGGACSGNGCGSLGTGSGALAFSPAGGLADAAGNAAGGSLALPGSFRLF